MPAGPGGTGAGGAGVKGGGQRETDPEGAVMRLLSFLLLLQPIARSRIFAPQSRPSY